VKRTQEEADDISLRSRIRRFYPIFFWHRCVICTNQFRREWGYKKIPKSSLLDSDTYVCKQCIPTKEDAFNYWRKKDCGGHDDDDDWGYKG